MHTVTTVRPETLTYMGPDTPLLREVLSAPVCKVPLSDMEQRAAALIKSRNGQPLRPAQEAAVFGRGNTSADLIMDRLESGSPRVATLFEIGALAASKNSTVQ